MVVKTILILSIAIICVSSQALSYPENTDNGTKCFRVTQCCKKEGFRCETYCEPVLHCVTHDSEVMKSIPKPNEEDQNNVEATTVEAPKEIVIRVAACLSGYRSDEAQRVLKLLLTFY